MSEIKVGDWVEVTSTLTSDELVNIEVGDKYEVLKKVPGRVHGGFLVTPKGHAKSSTTVLAVNQIKKAEPPAESAKVKTERVASDHYQNANNNDVWQFVDDNLSSERVKGFHQTNAIKYVTRYHLKHDTAEKRIEDLEKAKVCIDKLIELEREG